MSPWGLVAGMAAITFGLRLSIIGLPGRFGLPPLVRRALRFVPPAVFSAIIAPDVLVPDGTLAVSLGNARLAAAVCAALVAWRTRNVLATIATGMATLWLLQALLARGGP
ncbi:MAG: AzlD domain-containing protein [Armatimonadota bacterium]|nr:AzlD domain-containing protein [Armatimonadota bacterium]